MVMDEESNATRTQRVRLTCSHCHRRKIKCDKNIPCGSCIKRGIGDHCSREETGGSVAPTRREVATSSDDVVQELRNRILQLETRSPLSPGDNLGSNRPAARIVSPTNRNLGISGQGVEKPGLETDFTENGVQEREWRANAMSSRHHSLNAFSSNVPTLRFSDYPLRRLATALEEQNNPSICFRSVPPRA
ncbi:hypothetical protein BCR34DRAFT_368276 [Clohesyomyces aquaticus]|uniref:Zn(2)-C6 fungal-type domain-containing protein n=1 Tax=Clohesyomyces aquaticus TaxID=1231657 RepID=A0A1Y1ZH88_9PLEO|nr:hypothetical protein BCR34DRAFT_368276 [Clohesyomyces aquaticus]